ncbi:MAG: DsrE family protein [Anaerolineaceae bacterium]|jgi:hypothetical protein
MVKYQVIFHLDENDSAKINLVLNNIFNLLEDLGRDNVLVELLVNGPAVKAFQKSSQSIAEQVRQLADQGVAFALCNNSLKMFGFRLEDMLEQTSVVPSGVGELVKKQSKDWAYIRP